jgi:hypothetical protein
LLLSCEDDGTFWRKTKNLQAEKQRGGSLVSFRKYEEKKGGCKLGGVAFFFVGAVLFVTAMMMMGKAEAKSVGLFHGIVGVLLLSMVIKLFFVPPHDYFTATILLLFIFTYIPVCASFMFGVDTKALGWYCLIVAVVTIPIGLQMFEVAYKTSILLWIYGGLWFCFFLLMGLGKESLGKFVGYYTLVVSLLALIPGYMMIVDKW